ncbi:MAG: hypothetical protein AAB393_15040, partial [Bacteroidota bacterium]
RTWFWARQEPLHQRARRPPGEIVRHAEFSLHIQETYLVSEELFVPANAGPSVVWRRFGR